MRLWRSITASAVTLSESRLTGGCISAVRRGSSHHSVNPASRRLFWLESLGGINTRCRGLQMKPRACTVCTHVHPCLYQCCSARAHDQRVFWPACQRHFGSDWLS